MSGDLRRIQSGTFEFGPHDDLEIDSGFSNSLCNKKDKISNDRESQDRKKKSQVDQNGKENEPEQEDEMNKKGTDESGNESEKKKTNSTGMKVLKRVGIFAGTTVLITGAVIGGTTLALPLIGFGASGPIAGSLAALYQSSVLGGTIASGSAFATLQSFGMAGLTAAAQGTICAGSAAVSGIREVYHHVKNKKK